MTGSIKFLPAAVAVLFMLCACTAGADQVRLTPAMAKPFLLAGKKQTTFLKIGLSPFIMSDAKRVPVNVAIVLDRSGSMSGRKIRRAKEAAIMAVDRLHPDDIISVVAYNHVVEVLVPATKVRDRETIVRGINRLYAGGSTALFAGVSKGAAEIRKFADRNRVNRIVLLSDGLANVGPRSPVALGELGASLGREGIGVTTIGLGLDYNEDLMTQLALRSEGNHFFAATAADLRHGFDLEFSIGLQIVAKEVLIKVECARGVRPIRVLNAEADIVGQQVTAHLNQLYSGRDAYLLLEVEVPYSEPGQMLQVAKVAVSYANMETRATDVVSQDVGVRFTESPRVVERNADKDVMVAVAMHMANERYKMALDLRDQGKVDEARRILRANAWELDRKGKRFNSPQLRDFGESNKRSSDNLDRKKWKKERKRMRDEQLEVDQQSEAF